MIIGPQMHPGDIAWRSRTRPMKISLGMKVRCSMVLSSWMTPGDLERTKTLTSTALSTANAKAHFIPHNFKTFQAKSIMPKLNWEPAIPIAQMGFFSPRTLIGTSQFGACQKRMRRCPKRRIYLFTGRSQSRTHEILCHPTGVSL